MALNWTDRRGTNEPLPDDHPLKKGALICFGGQRAQAAAQNEHHELEDAIKALLSAPDDADVSEFVERARKVLKQWQGSLKQFHPKEPRPIEQITRLERVSDDLLTGAELDILERMAFERMSYGRRHGGGLHGGRYIK